MPHGNGDRLGDTDWRLAGGDEEVRFEHVDSGNAYVLEADGSLRVSGNGAIGREIHDLRETIASTLGRDGNGDPALREDGGGTGDGLREAGVRTGADLQENAVSTGSCSVRCSETTGELIVESSAGITVRAPVVDISGGDAVDIASPGGVRIFEEGETAVSVSATPDGAGATDALHRVEVSVGPALDGATLSTLGVDYPTGFDVGGVAPGDVLAAGIERAGGSVAPVPVSGTSVADGATAVSFTFDGNTLGGGDTVFVEYRGVANASTADDYPVFAAVNGSRVGVGTLSITPPSDAPDPVVSTFEAGDEGWEITGDAQGGSSVPTYEPGEGNPAPCISATDDVQGGVWYFSAPGKFLADKSAFYGGRLAFDLRQEFSGSPRQFGSADVVLEGGGTTVFYDFGGTGSHPGGGTSGPWSSYTVTLDEAAGWRHQDEDATESDLRTVLGDLTEMGIRGEYRTGSDKGYLDNVELAPPNA